MTDQGYTFNWHNLRDKDSGTDEGFLRWMLVNLVTFTRDEDDAVARVRGRDLLEQLRDASNGFTNVTLIIQANGIDLNVEYFVISVRRNMEWWARRAAVEELDRRTDVSELTNVIASLRDRVRHELNDVARELGIELNEDGDVL